MLMANDNAYAEEDLILSDFIGKRERWTQKREELYASLVRKGVNIETAQSGDMTVVSVGLHGVSVSAINHEPYVALSESMVRLVKFLKYTEANNVIIGKKNIPFSSAFYWMMKGLDARRTSWPKGLYIDVPWQHWQQRKALRILAGRGIRYCGRVRCDGDASPGNDEW